MKKKYNTRMLQNQSDPAVIALRKQLTKIDEVIRQFICEIVKDAVQDSDRYHLKTEMLNQCYNIELYNQDMHVIVGMTYPLIDLLEKCANKQLEYDLNKNIRRMLIKFKDKNLSQKKTNWIGVI